MIVITGGTVLTPDGWREEDVWLDDSLVASPPASRSHVTEIHARGCLVGPAFVDLHAHLREPGQTWKEDVASGSAAAAAGGYGAVVAMPNTDPPIDSVKMAETILNRGREVGLVDVLAAGTLTAGRSGLTPADLVSLYESGVRMFTDDGDSVPDIDLMRDIMVVAAGLPGAVVAQHAEDPALGRGHMHEGEMSQRLGVVGMPESAETDIVRRDLALVAETGAHYHCQHVSSARTVDLIREAKRAGLQVTAEVAPHHLSFTEAELGELDTDFKMYPPLRTAADQQALIEALADGTIDVVATDHAPHRRDEKRVPFPDAPRGVIGLETAAAAVWGELPDRDILFRAMSSEPSIIMGLDGHGTPIEPGKVANIVVFDPNAKWIPDRFESKSDNSPYRGREMTGRVKATIHNGVLTCQGATQ